MKNIKAFTLIELSIVIVIIGLIVAAVVSGSTLIESSKMSAVLSDKKKYETAINSFVGKYNALPGDMANAHDFFGDSCDDTASECNGNGDNIIVYDNSAQDNEALRFWQHLSLSGLIEGSYTGTGTPSTTSAFSVANVNTPGGPHENSAWWVNTNNVQNRIPYTPRVLLNYAKIMTSGAFGNPIDAIVTPLEARTLDKKIDNGLSTSFMVAIEGQNAPGGVNGQTCENNTSREYIVSNDEVYCRIGFAIIK